MLYMYMLQYIYMSAEKLVACFWLLGVTVPWSSTFTCSNCVGEEKHVYTNLVTCTPAASCAIIEIESLPEPHLKYSHTWLFNVI